MSLANTQTRYGTVTKTFHWLTALLIFTVIPLGIFAHDMPYDTSEQLARKAFLFSLHKTLGVTIFFVALARIAWAFTQQRPGLLNSEKPAESFLAHLVHWLLYGSLVMVPLTGWIHHSATTGFAPIFWPFGQSLPFVPKDDDLAHIFATFHMVFERIMVVSIALHIAGALKHHVIDKDATLRRMWFGGGDMPNVPKALHSAAPLLAASVIYLVAATAILFTHESDASTAPVPTLASVSSDWTVQEGSIDISVNQFGSDVSGSFADWTAAISYDRDTEDAVRGNVLATISIGSLTLGSVTDQAMGPDFFDAQTFPTAEFSGDIRARDEAHQLVGTLTIKGVSVPVEVPFDLRFEGDTASAEGRVSLNRLDFGIGQNMADESSLGFEVAVNIRLTAERQ